MFLLLLLFFVAGSVVIGVAAINVATYFYCCGGRISYV